MQAPNGLDVEMMIVTEPVQADDPKPRQRWLGILARAEAPDLAAQLAQAPTLPGTEPLRGPQIGLVMVRGRQGGSGGAFNLGEMTVTRCAVRSDAGWIGHAYIAGRDTEKAALVARLDAALQDPARREALLATVVEPLAAIEATRQAATAAQAAATRVEFMTLATMR